jgi:F-type H+-transporting ATPase subunit b
VQFDWLTVAAQIVNFLVLVWLLQRFLYRPITTAMLRREKRIEDRLSEAKATRRDAEDELRDLRERQAQIETERVAILDAARKEADALRARLEQDLRAENEERRAGWARHMAAERDDFMRLLQRQAGRQLVDLTGRVLKDYADSDIAGRVSDRFLAQLEDLDDDRRARLAEAARRSDAPAIVETGGAIDAAAKARMTRAIQKGLSTEIEVDYHEDETLVLGVRLIIGDQRLEWSAARHLRHLESEMNEILDARARAPADRSPEGHGAA